jgi:alkane 1-monooxygenase
LPTGYFGMIVLASLPPVWRRVMNVRTIAAVGGNRARLNLADRPIGRVTRAIDAFSKEETSH